MAQDSWPSPAHNSRAVTDVEYEKVASRFSDNGVYGDPQFNDQVVSAGLGLSVDVRSFVHASVRGHAWTSGTTTVNLPVGANSSGSTRIDRVVLRLDRSAWTVRAVVKPGTPGAGAPTLTQDSGDTGVWEIPLANVTVLNGAASVTVTRNELYVGTRTRPATASTLNPNSMVGEMAWETDTKRLRLWDGQSRRTIYARSEIINVDQAGGHWDIETQSVLEVRSGVVCLRLGSFKRHTTALAAGTASRLPVFIPAAYQHATRDQYVIAYLTGTEIGRIIIYSAASDTPGQVILTNKPAMSIGDFCLPCSGISWVVE